MLKKVLFIVIVFVGISKYGIKVLRMEVKSVASLGNGLVGYCYIHMALHGLTAVTNLP